MGLGMCHLKNECLTYVVVVWYRFRPFDDMVGPESLC